MKVLRIFILITLSACGQPSDTSNTSNEDIEIQFRKSTIPKDKPIYPDWLEKQLSLSDNNFSKKQELLNFKKVSLATAYCVLQETETSCRVQTLITFHNKIESSRVELGRHCDKDFSKDIRSWKEYKLLASNSFEITEYIETINPISKMQASSEIEKGIDYSDEEPSLEIIKKTVLINFNGEIIEIRDK